MHEHAILSVHQLIVKNARGNERNERRKKKSHTNQIGLNVRIVLHLRSITSAYFSSVIAIVTSIARQLVLDGLQETRSKLCVSDQYPIVWIKHRWLNELTQNTRPKNLC